MKKIFYNKRHKLPVWSQIYIVWLIFFLIALFYVLKFETVKTNSQISASFDYKKEYDIVSELFLKIQNKYPGVSAINKPLVGTLKAGLSPKSWNMDLITFEENKIACKITKYYSGSQKNSLSVIIERYGIPDSFYPLQTLVQAVINKNIENISIYSIDGHPVCMNFLFQKESIDKHADKKYLLVYPGKTNTSGLQVALSGNASSSIEWSSIIPFDISRPGIFNQLMESAISLAPKIVHNTDAPHAQSIGWYFPESDFQKDIEAVRHIIPRVLFTIENFSKINSFSEKSSIWINANTCISHRGSIILSFMMILLTWFPVINRLYQNESIRFMINSFFPAVFNSLLFFMVIFMVKITSFFVPESIAGISAIFAVFLPLYFLFNQIRKRLFYSNVNLLTNFIVFNIFSSMLALNNFSLFLFLLPLIFILSGTQNMSGNATRFLVVLALIPVLYALFHVSSHQNLNMIFSLIWLDKVIFADILSTILCIFFCGSMLTIIRKSA